MMDCAACTAKTGEDILNMCRIRNLAGGRGGNCGYCCNRNSAESEHDLAVLVSELLENGGGGGGGSYGAEPSWCSSDSDSGFCDLAYLASKISIYSNRLDQYEIDVESLVHSYLLSINEIDLLSSMLGACSGSCLRFCLVKLLRHLDMMPQLARLDELVMAKFLEGT